MGKEFFFRYALLIGFLLFSVLYIDNINPDYDIPNAYIDSVRNSSKIFTPYLIHNDKTLSVLGKHITLGDSVDSLLDTLGDPNRIAKTEMDFDYYVYNNNYSKLLFVAVRDNKVVGFYTDSIDFYYFGITYGSDLNKINLSLNTSFTMDYMLTHKTELYTLQVFMDELGTNKVTGISLLTSDVKANEYTTEILRDTELLIYDLTNSIRKRNAVPILSWSSTAAKAAGKHSIDMAENSYFGHYSTYDKNPGDRLREEGIDYQLIGENIIAGYENAIISCHAWYNSQEHRDNMLNKSFRNLGVGFTYIEDSIYKSYITQNFYR